MELRIATLCLAAALTAATPALSHVTLEQREAPVGASYKAVFKVGHGCGASPTVRLRVTIPEGVIAVKPMVKAGWRIGVTKGAYAKSYSFFHGATFSEGIKEVTWSGGRLPDAFYDEFVVSMFIAGELAPGRTLYFPVVQSCAQGAHNWVEVPAADKPGEPLSDPAPSLMLTPKK
jgi:uncharacterized protein YcnI